MIRLNVHDTLAEACVAVAAHLGYYNDGRIHSALNYRTPSQILAMPTLIARNASQSRFASRGVCD